MTEALNEEGEEYSDDRLVQAVSARAWSSPQEALEALLADVRAFSGDAVQSDDVTMVMVRYGGQT